MLFMLLPVFAGLHSVNGNVSKHGCLGDSIKLIENISYKSNDIVVTIYKKGDSKFILGMWRIQDAVPSIKNGKSDRLVLDQKGNIWIFDLIVSDEATYTIKIDIGNSSDIVDVPLAVIVPPTKHCKPDIIRWGNTLVAELKTDECGRPSASAYWLEHPGISLTARVIALQPGNDNGIYHACIKGDSLICAKISNFSEHCSFYNKSEPGALINQSVVEGPTPRNLPDNTQCASSDSSTITIIICVMVALWLIMMIMLNAKRIETIYQCMNKKSVPEHTSLPEVSSPNNQTGVPEPSRVTGVASSEMRTGEMQPLIHQSGADRSVSRRSLGTSSLEDEGSDTVNKNPVQDPFTLEDERGETASKYPAQVPLSQDEEGSESTDRDPLQDPQSKPTRIRTKIIIPLPPGNQRQETQSGQ